MNKYMNFILITFFLLSCNNGSTNEPCITTDSLDQFNDCPTDGLMRSCDQFACNGELAATFTLTPGLLENIGVLGQGCTVEGNKRGRTPLTTIKSGIHPLNQNFINLVYFANFS